MENTQWAKAGITISPSTKEASRAKVLVKASGLNSLPSAACMANTGRKLTMVVARAVIIAEPTSTEASYTISSKRLPLAPWFSGISRWRTMFSVNTMPTSTITPIAMAIPERATMLASTPNWRITIKVISTPTGSRLEIMIEARMFITSTNTTRILMSISCSRANSRVPRVSLISPVRS